MRIKNIIQEYHPLVSVSSQSTLKEATTKMMVNDFSQLAVTDESEKVVGFISWRTIGFADSYNANKDLVINFTDKNHLQISDNERVFEHFQSIIEKEFAFITDKEGNVYTILTLFDLALLFKLELEPFIELRAIETTLRKYIGNSINETQFLSFCNKNLSKRIKTPNDLTFGQYLRILGEESFWDEFQIPLHKETFLKKLDTIRLIRNKVMHFKTDKVTKTELKHLKDINKFFRVQAKMNRKS